MEFEVRRACDAGRVLQAHMRDAGRTRGMVAIRQEQDPVRHRAVLVARLLPKPGQRSIPPLFDVTVVASTGETWVLTGVERVEAGPMRDECSVGQTWMLNLAAVDELVGLELKWANAVAEAQALQRRVAELQAELDRIQQRPAVL